jgi:hypothetical protein
VPPEGLYILVLQVWNKLSPNKIAFRNMDIAQPLEYYQLVDLLRTGMSASTLGRDGLYHNNPSEIV